MLKTDYILSPKKKREIIRHSRGKVSGDRIKESYRKHI